MIADATRLYLGDTRVYDAEHGGGGTDETLTFDVANGLGQQTLAGTFVVKRVHVDVPVRIRFYLDATGRTADRARSIYTPYPGGCGLIYELNATEPGEHLVPFMGSTPLFWTADAVATITLTWRSIA